MGAMISAQLSQRPLAAVLMVVGSAACFGAMVLFGRFAYEDGMTPASLLFLRFAIAAPLLWLLAIGRGLPPVGVRAAGTAVLMGAVFVGNSLAYFVALSRAPAATVAVLFFTYPVIVLACERFLYRERAGRNGVLAVVLGSAGAALTVGPTDLSLDGGASLALLAAVFYSGYVLLARAGAAEVSPVLRTAIITSVAAGVLGIIAVRQGLTLPTSSSGWAATLALAVVSTVLALTLFLAGVAHLGPARAATVSAAEPAVAAMLAALFLHEPLGPTSMAGMAMVIASAVLVARAGRS